MQLNRSDLADFTYFLAIARHRSFRRAGVELGVSASALSHALKGLESRLGVRLLHRTNRSVTLTAAGEQLQDAIAGPFGEIGLAVEALNRFRDAPTGRIRLNVMGEAATNLIAPVLPLFVDRYPDVELEICANNRMVDIIESGFDAGIRYGGTVPEDMIAQRLSADFRWIVVAAPSYLERFGIPDRPEALQAHRCINMRMGNGTIYRWDFERDGAEFALSVPGSIVVDEAHSGLIAALGGAGLLYTPETSVASYLAQGGLRQVLGEWSAHGEGLHIYYPSRRQVPVGLRLLIDLIREQRPLGL